MSNPLGRVLVTVGIITAALGVAGPTGAAVPKLKRPGAPTSLTVFAADTAFVVSWGTPLSDGGAPVTAYTVTAKMRGAKTETCSTSGALSCVVSGIENPLGQRRAIYHVTVTATNSIGTGRSAHILSSGSTVQDCSYLGPYANLQYCNLSRTDLSGRDLFDANMTHTDLSNANLSNADLGDAQFFETILTGTDLGGANLAGEISNLTVGAPSALPEHWMDVDGVLIGPGADLGSFNLSNFDLAGADLAGANLTSVNLTGADLSGADLDHTSLDFVTLTGTILAGADLTGVQSDAIAGQPSSLPTNWLLADGYLFGPGAYLYNLWVPNVNLAGADLSGAHLPRAGLTGADLTGADLTGADLTDANLTGADLTGANLTGADLTGVTWSVTTCPDGSNSDTNGSSPASCIGHGI
jgi:uncharacterized protein YjbI with pentapeptide repeats